MGEKLPINVSEHSHGQSWTNIKMLLPIACLFFVKRAAQCIRQHVWVSIYSASSVRNIFPSDEHVTTYAENAHVNACTEGFHVNSPVIFIRFSWKIEIGWNIFHNTLLRSSLTEIRSAHPIPFTWHWNKSSARCKRAEGSQKYVTSWGTAHLQNGITPQLDSTFHAFSRNPKGHYCAHMRPPLQPVLSQMNSVHISYSYPTSLTTSFIPLKSSHFP
jgi:hypothetical protein